MTPASAVLASDLIALPLNIALPSPSNRVEGTSIFESGIIDTSQQAISQAERWQSNPTVRFIQRWMKALGGRVVIRLEE